MTSKRFYHIISSTYTHMTNTGFIAFWYEVLNSQLLSRIKVYLLLTLQPFCEAEIMLYPTETLGGGRCYHLEVVPSASWSFLYHHGGKMGTKQSIRDWGIFPIAMSLPTGLPSTLVLLIFYWAEVVTICCPKGLENTRKQMEFLLNIALFH